MEDQFIGQIIMFAGRFAPRGWAYCDGRVLSINQNSALFSILGTTYGGDGRTIFGLPDLTGRAPIHAGSGPGLSPVRLGSKFGTETNTMRISEMPTHSHVGAIKVAKVAGDDDTPTLTTSIGAGQEIFIEKMPNMTIAPNSVTVSNTGGATDGPSPINNMQPYQAVNYIIALTGLYPARN